MLLSVSIVFIGWTGLWDASDGPFRCYRDVCVCVSRVNPILNHPADHSPAEARPAFEAPHAP